MHLSYPPPLWLAIVLGAMVAGLAFLEYRRPFVPLTFLRRLVLAGCRALVLATLGLFLFRPFVLVAPRSPGAVVPVLVDVSRSMRVNDANGETRLVQGEAVLRSELLPALSAAFTPELYAMDDRIEPVSSFDRLDTRGRGSDIGGALAAIRSRYRGRPLAGIVLLSDGGDTGGRLSDDALGAGPPVFTVGLGSPDRIRDREVTGIVAGDQRLEQTSVDLRVSVTSTSFGRAPFSLRLLANGRQVEDRRVVPRADGVPTDETFTVSPDPSAPTVYRAEIPADDGEAAVENNARSVLVSPSGRKRRLLVVAGAPGFEHTFLLRAWARDPSLEVDAVVRKGRNVEGQDTFFVQTAGGRTLNVTAGFPSKREDLYAYDALVIANMEGDSFSRDALAMIADFVAERGGGLLVVGGRSFSGPGLRRTPLEPVLPIELSDRRPAGLSSDASPGPRDKVVLTPAGERHPATRIGSSVEETRKMWSGLPSLAATASLGGPRPGATVLAVAAGSSGRVYPVIAVQQYGKGRSMAFSGEASWRWRMMLPSTDRSYELVWRQAARWLAGSSPDPFMIGVPDRVGTGEAVTLTFDVRDATFVPVATAAVDARLTAPDGETTSLKPRRSAGEPGRFVADVVVEQDGPYRITAEAHDSAATLGSAVSWMYVGGVDREFVEPRLNEPVLRRLARASGGRYVRTAEAGRIVTWLREATREAGAPVRRDLWHEPWAYGLIVAALSAEWIMRRRMGLR